ncbi:myosin-11 [Nematostella vectensis]|uniref:myosin-11 n=1 Tax=Nematostella vectensis TaxID=45351 RepID=UPI0020778180|nr:myosin-11 [Nematostella vectensis]
MSSLVILDSDKQETADIDARLKSDGYSTTIPVEHKLRYIWRQLTRAESSLKSSLDSVEQLRKQHAEEMIEVENYVSHIRQLSDEREALTQDTEAENDQLKAELQQMKMDQIAGTVVSEGICDMLMEAGLTQVAKDTNSVKNQISFLLKERVGNKETIRKLEKEKDLFQKEASSGQANKKAMEMVEAERREMEEEMNRMRKSTQQVKLEMSKMHEKQLEEVTNEKNKLNLEIQKMQKQHNDDMAELIKRFEDEKMKLDEARESEKAKTTQHLTKAERVLSEMEEIKLKMKAIEQEKLSLQTTVKSLEDEIKKEKEQLKKNKVAQDEQGKKLKMEVSMTRQKLQEAEAKIRSLQEECKNLESQLNMANTDLKNIREKEFKLNSEKENLLTEGKTSSQKLQSKINTLTDENNSLKVRLKTTDGTIERQIQQVESLTVQLAESERMLRDKEEDMEDLDKNSKNEINSLKAKLAKANDELSDLRDELSETKQGYEKVMQKAKQEASLFKEKLNEETGRSRDVEGDRALLKAQIADLRKDLEASLAASMSREKETMEQVSSLQAEKDNLARELAAYITREKNLARQSDDLSLQVQTLDAEKRSLQSLVSSQEKQVADLSVKLEKSSERCRLMEQQLQMEQSKSTELTTKFQYSSQSSSSAKQEADALKDEVKALTQQLLRQHDASLDSRSKYEKLIMNIRGEMEREREKMSSERHTLASQLEQATRENKDLNSLLRNRDEELSSLRQELSNVSTTGTKASTALEFESKIRGSLEARTNHLESELTRAWEHNKELTTAVSNLEANKRHLEVELDRKTQQVRQAESTLQRRQAEHTALVVSKDTAQQQADEAEAKLAALRKEYENVIGELEKTQADLKTASEQLMEMHMKNEENDKLRGHLQEEEAIKGIQQQTVQELERQVGLLQERNNALQRTVKEHETLMDKLKQKIVRSTDQQKEKENETKTLAERMNEVFQENEMLRKELIAAADRIDNLQRRSDEKKTKTQAKVQALRDHFAREKRSLESTVLSLQSRLELSLERVVKEEEWENTTATTIKTLQQERADLLTRLTDGEELIREYQRQTRQSEARAAMLDKENIELQSRINVLLRDKSELSRQLTTKNRSLVTSPLNSPQQNGPIDSQILMSALARLHQPELDRTLSSPDLYSPEDRSPLNRSINPTLNMNNNYISPERRTPLSRSTGSGSGPTGSGGRLGLSTRSQS